MVDLNKPNFFAGSLFNPRVVCKDCGREALGIALTIHPWSTGVSLDNDDEDDEDW